VEKQDVTAALASSSRFSRKTFSHDASADSGHVAPEPRTGLLSSLIHLGVLSMKFAVQSLWSVLLLLVATTAWAQVATSYQLRHGDVLTVSVWKEEALRMEVRVLPDGSITFPLAGRVEVAGLTTPQAEERIASKIRKFIPEAAVTVAVTGIEGSRVYVLGKVIQPGPVTLMSPSTTVLQVISQARGLDRFANGNAIQVLRQTSAGTTVLPVRYDDLIRGNSLETNVVLQPGDTILVP
jgi:polysaccharide export outer membrane protein